MLRIVKYLLLFILSHFITNGYSQSLKRVDSLQKLLTTAKADTSVADLFIALATTYYWNKTDSMIAYAEKAKILSEKINYQKGLFNSYYSLASSRFVTGEFGKGLIESKKALVIARKNKNEDWEAKISNTIGLLYLRSDKYKDAIDYFELNIAFDKKQNNMHSLGNAYNNLANCYMGLKEYQHSIQIRKQSILIRKQLDDPSALGDCYNDLGETYIHLNKNDSATYYLLQCLAIKEKIGDDEMIAVAGQNLGVAYEHLHDLSNAKKYLLKSYERSVMINSTIYIFGNLKLRAKIAAQENDHKLEAKLLNRILSLSDTIYNEENRKQINQLNTEFETEKKELKINSLQLEQQKQQVFVEEEKKINLLIIIFSSFSIILLGTFLVLVTNRFRITKKQKMIIQEQKNVVEVKQKEIVDSIQYAKRIQQSLLPTEKYIGKNLNRLQKK